MKKILIMILLLASFIMFDNVYAANKVNDALFKYDFSGEILKEKTDDGYKITIPVKIYTNNSGKGLGGYYLKPSIQNVINFDVSIENLKSDYIEKIDVVKELTNVKMEISFNKDYDDVLFEEDTLIAEYDIVINSDEVPSIITFNSGKKSYIIKIESSTLENSGEVIQKKGTSVWLIVGLSVVGLVIVSIVVLFIIKKKK